MIGAAQRFATDFRWRVFPVGGDGRTPLIARGCHGASCDVGVLAGWWRAHPSANIALACGPGSGVLGLDIDRKGDVDGLAHLAALEAEFGKLPRTVTSLTPTGGLHMLFAYPPGPDPANRVGLKRYGADGERTVYHGLDVRAAGASLCLPPSVRLDGAYRWAVGPDDAPPAPIPDWLLSLMRSEPPPRPPAAPLKLSSRTGPRDTFAPPLMGSAGSWRAWRRVQGAINACS
jgi:putative DNA primase/helicase